MSEHDRAPGAEDRVDLTGLSRLADRPPPPRGEGAVRVVRALSILLLAVAAAGLPWYFMTRSSPPASPGARSSPTASTTPSPSPSPSTTPGTVEVFGVEDCLNIRTEPSTSSARLDCLTPGIRLETDGATREAGGRLWRHVRDPFKNVWGWAADQYLKPVA